MNLKHNIFCFFLALVASCQINPQTQQVEKQISPQEQRLTEIRSMYQDSIENIKTAIFAQNNKQISANTLDSIIYSYSENPQKLFPNCEVGDQILRFNYKLDNELINVIKEDKSYPYWFKQTLLKGMPVYIYIKSSEVNWGGDGNRFADGGLSEEQVGEAYHQGDYQNEKGYLYQLSFIYLDKKYENVDTKFARSCFMTDNPYFGFIEIGRPGVEGYLYNDFFNILTYPFQVHLNGNDAPIDASFSDGSVFSNNAGSLIEKLFRNNIKNKSIMDLCESPMVRVTDLSVNGGSSLMFSTPNPTLHEF